MVMGGLSRLSATLHPEPRGRLGREQLLDFEATLADALLVSEIEKGLEGAAIGLDAVGPEVLAEDGRDLLGPRRKPGQRNARGVVFAEPRQAPALGGLETLEQVHGDPAVTVVNLAADRDRVHDREDAGLAVVGELDGRVILEEPADPGLALLVSLRRMRGHHRVE